MPISVLIADDSQIVRKVLCDCLAELTDWKIAADVDDGAKAIQKAAEEKPDLFLLDFSMPTMNGLEAASVLKKMYPDVPVVVFTMFHDALGSALCSAAGIDLVIPKGLGLINLVQCINRLMKKKIDPHVKPSDQEFGPAA